MLKYYGADPDFSLAGKTAIITGGAAGIGLCTAEFLIKKDVNLILADLDPAVTDTAKMLSKTKALGVCGDISTAACRQNVLEAGCRHFGIIDILINCAGIVALDKAESISVSDWQRTLDINLTASFMMAQLLGKYFIENRIPGTIINMASQAGVVALENHVAYCASKGGVIAMTRVMAMEWGKYGIRVNAVSPTVVLTQLGHKAWDGPVGEAFKSQIPARRFAEPDEVAAAIAFLCSGGAGMISGHNLLIDGGYTIQ